jgi:hypothetical protein
MLERHVMPLRRQHANVFRGGVGFVTITVMHDLSSLEFTLEHFLSQQAMHTNRFTEFPGSRVRISLVADRQILLQR